MSCTLKNQGKKYDYNQTNYGNILKSLKGQKVLIALVSHESGLEHYYSGKLLAIQPSYIRILYKIGRIWKKPHIVTVNRKAFQILYVSEIH